MGQIIQVAIVKESKVDVQFVEDVFVPRARGFDGGPSSWSLEAQPVRPNKRRGKARETSAQKEFIGDFREDMRFPAPLNLKP